MPDQQLNWNHSIMLLQCLHQRGFISNITGCVFLLQYYTGMKIPKEFERYYQRNVILVLKIDLVIEDIFYLVKPFSIVRILLIISLLIVFSSII